MPGSGADAVCRALCDAGVRHVFGLPGTQDLALWDALRRAEAPRAVVPTHELAAAFMANGYARATGEVGVLLTIPGPGFAYALAGLAEARLDSVPLVHLVGAPAARDDGGFALQAIPQREMVAPLVKEVVAVADADALAPAVAGALALARAGEPGPVVIEVAPALLAASAGASHTPAPAPVAPAAGADVDAVAARLAAARRPLLLCGLGAVGGATAVRRLADAIGLPVMTTTSGRGALGEGHQLDLTLDAPGASVEAQAALLDTCDLVLVAGCKLSHNGSRGFRLPLPADKVVRIDASEDVLGRAYPAGLEVVADVPSFLAALCDAIDEESASDWTETELARWRARLDEVALPLPQPSLAGIRAAAFFASLREVVPAAVPVSTDSGLHQYLVRRHLHVLEPRTLLVPTDFQSMGFGVPAAIGAALATGGPAVAVVGDGGIRMTGLELATAVRESVILVVLALVDGSYGLIRLQQLRRSGRESGVGLPPVDLALLAASVGARHVLVDGEPGAAVGDALTGGGVTLLEVPVEDAPGVMRDRRLGRVRGVLESVAGPDLVRRARGRAPC